MRHIESDKPIYSWDVIQFIYQGSLLCTHCVRQQSPSTPDNAEVLPSAITSSRNQIFYAHQFLTRVGERKEKGHTPCRVQLLPSWRGTSV